jgi:hypothetical protein
MAGAPVVILGPSTDMLCMAWLESMVFMTASAFWLNATGSNGVVVPPQAARVRELASDNAAGARRLNDTRIRYSSEGKRSLNPLQQI